MTKKLKKLEIGSGGRPREGYIHLDAWAAVKPDILWDATNIPYPFKENELDEIYSHWVLEHFSVRDIERIIPEWERILKPGGKVIAVTNNQEAHNKCLQDKKITWEEWCRLTYGVREPGEITGYRPVDVWECHKIGWTEERLRNTFTRHGFQVEKIITGWECRMPDGGIKCPGLTITAIKPT